MKMTSQERLSRSLVAAEANDNFSEAVLRFKDASLLCFCHRVGERWAKALGPDRREDDQGLAGELLATITLFRLNAKHLDVEFADGSRWEQAVPQFGNTGTREQPSTDTRPSP